MAKPPHARKRVSQEELNREFNENGWEERLKNCKQIEYYDETTPAEAGQSWGTRTLGYEYHEGGVFIALVFHYRRTDGTIGASGKPTPKMLLIGEVYHYV